MNRNKNENKKRITAIVSLAVFIFAGLSAAAVIFITDTRTDYAVSASLDTESMTLQTVTAVNYKNDTGATLNEIKFNLYANAFREGAAVKPYFESDLKISFPDGMNYGEATVKSVRSGGNALSYSVNGKDKNVLTVALGKPLKNRLSAKIEIACDLRLPKTNMRLGYYGGIINLTNFFPSVCVFENGAFTECLYLPTGDPFYSETADFKVELRTDGDYKVAHSGDLKSEKTENGGKIFKFEGKKIRDFALVLSESFVVKTVKSGGVTLKYFAEAGSGAENAETKLAATESALNFFGDYYFKYPYKTYCVAETYLAAGGMEYPNLSLISRDLKEADKDTVIVHETAHQWWYGIIGNDNLNYAWMDEGLAEFSVELYFAKNGRTLKANEYRHFNLRESRRFDEIIRDLGGSPVMEKYLGDFVSNYEYVAVTYSRGHLLFADVYETLGDENFRKAMRYYAKKNKYRIARKNDMLDAFNKYADGDMRTLFGEWTNFSKKY